MMKLFCVILAFLLSGCISVNESINPRFYMLRPIDKNKEVQTFDIQPNVIVGVGPVKIPEYLDRPQIVTQDKSGMLRFAQFDRWGELLSSRLAQVITINLTKMLPGANFQTFPADFFMPLKYQLTFDVFQLESDLDKDLFLVVQWSIKDAYRKQVLFTKKSEFRRPINPHNYTGLTEALSVACGSLSAEIAQALSMQVKDDKIKPPPFSH